MVDEQKKDGLILSYKVLRAQPADRQDWDMMLMVEYKNHAALDGLDAKVRAIAAKSVGNDDAQRSLATKRLDVREILGGKVAQEILIK